MKMKYLYLPVLGALLFGGSVVAGEHERGRHHGPHAAHFMQHGAAPERHLKHLQRVLDLDESQQQALSNVVAAAEPEFAALAEKAREQREAMHALDVNDDNYTTDLQNLAAAAGELAMQSVLLHGRLRAEIAAELSDEQRSQLAEAMQSRHERWRERRADRKKDQS
jgi:Spy/CpxP family protein refolding chaperone